MARLFVLLDAPEQAHCGPRPYHAPARLISQRHPALRMAVPALLGVVRFDFGAEHRERDAQSIGDAPHAVPTRGCAASFDAAKGADREAGLEGDGLLGDVTVFANALEGDGESRIGDGGAWHGGEAWHRARTDARLQMPRH